MNLRRALVATKIAALFSSLYLSDLAQEIEEDAINDDGLKQH